MYEKTVAWDPGTANPKQIRFFRSRAPFTAYGGAKGGGKTWAVRVKAVGGALHNPGIRILILRRTYPELEENHIRPVLAMTPPELAAYNGSSRLLRFANGSVIKFGHWNGPNAEQEYQGLEFDWIFLDEATQFTERAFRYLGGCLRGVNRFPKRMYLTCNPGGVGHAWVKRLFIDRDFRRDPENPEADENPDDYVFIPATVEDNPQLLRASPGYLRMLAAMPENLRRAYRYGDWDALGGCYFAELDEARHTCPDFPVPAHWARYRAVDYGLDMLACLWVAVDDGGRAYVYRELARKDLTVREAAAAILAAETPGETVAATFAPPDLRARQKDSGRSMAELFAAAGVPLTRASSDRVQGHMLVKDALAPGPDGRPGLVLFRSCARILGDLRDIQADPLRPGDCARTPHDVTHTVDALRYFCISRAAPAEPPPPPPDPDDGDDDGGDAYAAFLCGGEAGRGYLEI